MRIQQEAQCHMAANEKSLGSESVAFDGGAVKALGNGRVGGYLILFSGPKDPDLQGDYFTKSTDFFLDSGESRFILYRHGTHPTVKSKKLGKGTIKIDDVGVFIEGELDVRDKYIAAIYALAEKGGLGWSSGSMTHLVQRVANGKSFEIKEWPIGEASLTPMPVEARTMAFPIKELAEDEVDLDSVVKSLDQDEFEQQFSIEGIPSIKAFCEAVAPNSLQDGSHRSNSAANAAKEFITITKILGEAYDSYSSRLVKRTESRFLKQGREIDPSTVKQVGTTLDEMDRVISAFQSVKESLSGIKQIADMSVAEQRAMNERARIAMWELCNISGLTPEELENAGTSAG
jgi:hypothetical protein